MSALGERLFWARTQADLSQQELGSLAECSAASIGAVERGERPGGQVLGKIARVLEISLDWLALGRGPRPTEEWLKAAAERARLERTREGATT